MSAANRGPIAGLLNWWQTRGLDAGINNDRYVVIDLETSGLDSGSDRILSIGGIALRGTEIQIEDSFEALIRQPLPSSHENIVIHGISGSAQLTGQDEAEVLRAFNQWRAGAPILGWHIAFDMGFLRKAWQRHNLDQPPKEVLDLAPLTQALFKDSSTNSLDQWLGRFMIPVKARHSAAADAWMTAQLAARVLTEARQQGAHRWRDWKKTADSLRWTGS